MNCVVYPFRLKWLTFDKSITDLWMWVIYLMQLPYNYSFYDSYSNYVIFSCYTLYPTRLKLMLPAMKFIKSESVLYLKMTLLWKTYLWIQEQTLPILVISIVSIAYRSLSHNLLFERLKSPDQTAVMKITLLNVKEHNLICLTRRRLQHIKFSPGNMS